METRSIERLNLLHPKIRNVGLDAYSHAVHFTPAGVHPFVTETLRTFEKQAEYYAQGRTRPGRIITWSKPGQSYHQYGLAIDFVNLVNGKEAWNVDDNWMIVVEIFKSYGFKWGGDWLKKQDPPHFEMTFGHHWSDLLTLYDKRKVDPQGYVLI